MPTYDYIIIGAGASGLLLADALGQEPFFKNKRILLLDKSDKSKNDRTWCFWESSKGNFESILHHQWANIHFAGKEIDIRPNISPFSYKMIQGVDFYKNYFKRLSTYPNVTFLQDQIESINKDENSIEVVGSNAKYEAERVFDSRFDYEKLKAQTKYPVLQQHFLGWFVTTAKPVFDPSTATFMDFSIPQKGNTRFMYVLPFSETKALIEYTLFSEDVLEKSTYENAIEDYLTSKLKITNYKITEKEQGNIPMTCFDFSRENTNRYLKIGIAGGWAKASTGFTFYNSTKKARQLVSYLKKGKSLSKFQKKNRYWFYDLLFLDVLHKNNHLGSHVFESLFKKRSPQLVLKFLDEETSLWEDFKVIWACPKIPFIKALLRRLLSL